MLIIVMNVLKTELVVIVIAQQELIQLQINNFAQIVIISAYIAQLQIQIVILVLEIESMLQLVIAQMDFMKLKINHVKLVNGNA